MIFKNYCRIRLVASEGSARATAKTWWLGLSRSLCSSYTPAVALLNLSNSFI